MGGSTRTCQSTGVWSGSTPTCQGVLLYTESESVYVQHRQAFGAGVYKRRLYSLHMCT